MVRGKKVMHLPGSPAFDYLPGETVIFPANQPMEIDFPDADMETPTQCIALAVDGQYVRETVNYLNNYYQSPDEHSNWKLQFNTYHFENDDEVSGLINKLIRICSSGETTKNIFADLNLKELLIRLMQSQHMLAGDLRSPHQQQSQPPAFRAELHPRAPHGKDRGGYAQQAGLPEPQHILQMVPRAVRRHPRWNTIILREREDEHEPSSC